MRRIEYIRSLPDRELAKLLYELTMDPDRIGFCRNLQACDEDLERFDTIPPEHCIVCMELYLQQEMEPGGLLKLGS